MTSLDILGTAAAAVYLDCSVEALRKAIQRGALRPDQQVGRSFVFSRATLDEYRRTKRGVGRPKSASPNPEGA